MYSATSHRCDEFSASDRNRAVRKLWAPRVSRRLPYPARGCCSPVHSTDAVHYGHIAAQNAKDAKTKTQNLEEFKTKSMHLDGIKEINNVEGYEVILKETDTASEGEILSYDEAKEL